MDRITVNPKVHFGKPCVVGTRITVQSVLELVNEGLAFEEIVQDYYPDLTVEDVRACVQYAIALVAGVTGPVICGGLPAISGSLTKPLVESG
ncbi:MAG: DUF433 domain-containing protein [Chloroflexia bacterium]|nr:DUF433 domain-containing protein [Chloroflexia bacterium]